MTARREYVWLMVEYGTVSRSLVKMTTVTKLPKRQRKYVLRRSNKLGTTFVHSIISRKVSKNTNKVPWKALLIVPAVFLFIKGLLVTWAYMFCWVLSGEKYLMDMPESYRFFFMVSLVLSTLLALFPARLAYDVLIE